MITHTEEITFQKETGSNIKVSLQHIDQHMDQLNNPGDTYYVPGDGFHIVKLDDDEVLLMDNTTINQQILTAYVVFKSNTDPMGIILKSKTALALEQANRNRPIADGGPTPAPSLTLAAVVTQLGFTYRVQSLDDIFAQIVMMPRYLASVRAMKSNQLNTPFNMFAWLTWTNTSQPTTHDIPTGQYPTRTAIPFNNIVRSRNFLASQLTSRPEPAAGSLAARTTYGNIFLEMPGVYLIRGRCSTTNTSNYPTTLGAKSSLLINGNTIDVQGQTGWASAEIQFAFVYCITQAELDAGVDGKARLEITAEINGGGNSTYPLSRAEAHIAYLG